MSLFDFEEQANRVKKVRKILKMSQKDFANLLGVTQGYISDLERAGRKISRDLLENIANCYYQKTKKVLSLDWLLMGMGEPDLSSDKKPTRIVELEAQIELLKSMIKK